MAEIDSELFLALSLIATGLVQAIKAAKVPDGFLPLAAIIVGLATALVWGDGPWREVSLTGVAVGLSSVGLYSGIKTSQKGIVAQRRGTRPLVAERPVQAHPLSEIIDSAGPVHGEPESSDDDQPN